MRWARRARKTLFVLAISFITTTQLALAADPDPQPTTPTGFADLLPTPDLSHSDGKTLFENYSPMAYGIDFDASVRDPVETVFNGYAHLVMMYIVAITRGAIAVGWWLFSFTDIKPLTETATSAIGSVNTNLVGWLLPSALAFGAVAAYSQRRAGGSAMGQLTWVLAAGVIATSFSVAPATWLDGVDGARKFGSDVVVATSTDALGDTVKAPIAWPEPSFTGQKEDNLLRKSGDSSWRAFVVMPWCVAEFGSLAACERYGKAILDKGTDGEARNKFIDNELVDAEGGSDAATVQWAKGENPFGRVGVLTLGAIVATLFAALTLSLAFTALMAFVGCLLLLIIGMFFVCMWIIPGRPRQWGMNWFEALVGLVLQSFLAMLIFSVTLTLLTAVFGLTDTLGWLPVSGLAIAVLVAGFRLRRMVESMATMMRPGMASVAMGGMARRGAMRAVRRMMGAVNSRAASPIPSTDRGRDRAMPQERAERMSSVRVYRQSPAPGMSAKGLGGAARPAHELPGVADRRAIGSAPAGGVGGPGGRKDAALHRDSQGNRQGSDSAGVVAARLSGAKVDGGGRGGRRAVTVGASTVATSGQSSKSDTRKGRHVRQNAAAQAAGPRYEPRNQTYSASLRDGPPKAHRDRRSRSSSGPQRRFRDYSTVTKDGVTVLVPRSR
ncbi:hypothetical protein OG394_12725 [Kribbella sp. NBC_01245]|uniref:hypothetical protein n=1 Tax=Kribbella sp. NBC_01245 TaxID=2903578 RepID=UPI002E28D207|nr:hypothetical protein [Kribbella sp. NBC_01245]